MENFEVTTAVFNTIDEMINLSPTGTVNIGELREKVKIAENRLYDPAFADQRIYSGSWRSWMRTYASQLRSILTFLENNTIGTEFRMIDIGD